MSDDQTNPTSPPSTPPGARLLAGAAGRIPEAELVVRELALEPGAQIIVRHGSRAAGGPG